MCHRAAGALQSATGDGSSLSHRMESILSPSCVRLAAWALARINRTYGGHWRKAIRCMGPFGRKAYSIGAAIGHPSVAVSIPGKTNGVEYKEQSPDADAKDNVITDCILQTRNARPWTLFIIRCAI